jgi:YbbR-like protein
VSEDDTIISRLREQLAYTLHELRRRRKRMTRESLVRGLKSLGWVVPLTVVIWVYAEREQTNTRTVEDVPVEIKSTERYVEPSDGIPPKVTLILSGPQAGLQKVAEELQTSIPPGLPDIEIGTSMNPGNDLSVNVVDRIKDDQLFKENGVSVVESHPKQLSVNVDRKEERELPVQSPPDANLNTATTHYDPVTVTVSGPAKVLDSLSEQKLLAAYAQISGNDVLKVPGVHEMNVEVGLPPLSTKETRVTFKPKVVKATLDVRPTDVVLVIKSLPVKIEAPPALLDTYQVVFGEGGATDNNATVTDIKVTGPPSLQPQLDSEDKWARLTISNDDVGKSAQPRTLEYHIPGFQVTKDSQDKQVTFELKSRAAQ